MRRVEHWTRREAPPSGVEVSLGMSAEIGLSQPRGLGRLAWALCAAAEGMAVAWWSCCWLDM